MDQALENVELQIEPNKPYTPKYMSYYKIQKTFLQHRTIRSEIQAHLLRGHPFKRSTRSGYGESSSEGCMWTGVKPHVDVHTEN